MRHAGDERLVRDAFLKRLDLDVSQIAGRKADIYSPILYARRPCRLFEPGKLRLGCNRFELTFLESFESFMFLRINFRIRFTFA